MSLMASRLRESRRSKRLTLQQVSDYLGFKTHAAYHKYERGVVLPATDKLAKLAGLFGVSMAYLLGEQQTPSLPPMVRAIMDGGLPGLLHAQIDEIVAKAPPGKLGELSAMLGEFRRKL